MAHEESRVCFEQSMISFSAANVSDGTLHHPEVQSIFIVTV